MVVMDLDAIRARDADWTTPPWEVVNGDIVAAYADRRALLAEVDRLMAENVALRTHYSDGVLDGAREGRAAERARALPVIEAARRLLRRSGSVLMTDSEQEDWEALRDLLAEYDR